MPNEVTPYQNQSPANPFAKMQSQHISAGTVAIESERAVAEAQGKILIAKRFPRDEARAYAKIMDACKRPEFADEAQYAFPRAGGSVTGGSIRLAEEMARCWGNIDYGIRELSRKDGVSEMEAYAWDLETNTMSSQKFTVRHIRDTRGGGKDLTDERDIYELTANMGGRRLRARIFAVMPHDLYKAAVAQCNHTLANDKSSGPLSDRVKKMASVFSDIGVTGKMLAGYLGHPVDETTPEEISSLTAIFNAVRAGEAAVGDFFGEKAESEKPAAGSTVTAVAEHLAKMGVPANRRSRKADAQAPALEQSPAPEQAQGSALSDDTPPPSDEAPPPDGQSEIF